MKKPYSRFFIASIFTGLLIGVSLLLPNGKLNFLRIFGAFFALLSLGFFISPPFTLRKYGKIREGESFLDTQVVVDQGLFGIVRHPQYLGYLFLVVSFMLRTQDWLTTFFGTGALVFFYLHILQEEAYCLAKFGGDYQEFMQRVPRLNVLAGIFRYLKRKNHAH